MKCSFCSKKEVKDDQSLLCKSCISALQDGEVPPLDFKGFFTEGLERGQKEVDSLLMSMPENFFLWYLKGHLEHELGSTKKALNSIKTSISFKEDYGDSWIRLGLIYSDMHKEGEAIENFKKGLRYPLMDPSNLVDAGISLQASENTKLASKILQRALDLVPDDDRAIVGLGKVYSHMGNLEDAKEVLQQGLELYPHNEEVLRAMAQIILRMEDLDSAMEMYSRILDQHPRDFEALLAKGEIHLRKRELGQSIKAYMAVRDLDIHISWSGIIRFLISSIRSLLELNKNSLSYRDDLKKEYENILLYLKELEVNGSPSIGPESLDEIEKLIKIIESQRLNLKDQMGQFKDLLERYKVEDSFHQHLEGKLDKLKGYIEDGRYFDAKQITLELSPFLTDLGSMNSRNEEKIKESLNTKLKELKEMGMENKDLQIRLEEVEKLEEEGNSEGATFMLKEVEISLEEYYIECVDQVAENRLKEMESLVKDARNRFDVSGLQELIKRFRASSDKGLKAIQKVYTDFIKRYDEDSSTFYKEETSKILKEIDYKLVILEKDEMEVSDAREGYRDLISDMESDLTPKEGLEKVKLFIEEIKELEEKHKLSQIRDRLRGLDTLLGEVDSLGLDDAVAKNVEPVRRVIERSLKQNNYRLSEILTNEVYDNVEKLLRDNYLDRIKDLIRELEGEVFRFKGLGLFKEEWGESMEMSTRIISKKEKGHMTDVISNMARVNTELQSFYIEKLPSEIDRKVEDVRELLKEGKDLDIDLSAFDKEFKKIEKASEDISTLDLLEDSYKVETDIEREIRSQISEKVLILSQEVRIRSEKVDELSLSKKDLLPILSEVNRAEVLIESSQEREAIHRILKAHKEMEEIWTEVLTELKESRMEQIEGLLEIAKELDMDTTDFEQDRSVIIMDKEPDPLSDLELAEAVHEGLVKMIGTNCRDIAKGFRKDLGEMIDKSAELIPDDVKLEAREVMKDLKKALEDKRYEDFPELVTSSIGLRKTIKDKAIETRHLERCSSILEIGFSIDNEDAKELVNKAQELANRIKKGEREGIEIEIKDLQRIAGDLRSLQQMHEIEKMLQNIQDMDELASEIGSNLGDGSELQQELEEITGRIGKMIDRTSKLYNDPDKEMVEDMKDEISIVWSELGEIENRWKAERRLQTIKDAGLMKRGIPDQLLRADVDNLMEHFRSREWTKFFRTWERIETQMKKMKDQGELKGIDMDILPPVDLKSDKGIGIISRKRIQKKEKTAGVGSKKMGGGIQKLAQDMAKKRDMIEGSNEEEGKVKQKKKRAKEEEQIDDEAPEEQYMEEEDISGIAKMIAGARIEELKKKRSKVLDADEITGEEREDQKAMIEGSGHPVNELENLELDTSLKRVDIDEDIEKVKLKLIAFFDKLPDIPQLDDAKDHFQRAEELIEGQEKAKALKEYRNAMKLAIAVGKVHAEMGRSLKKIKNKLKELKSIGLVYEKAEALYKESEEFYRKGDFLGSAQKIKLIKDELTRE